MKYQVQEMLRVERIFEANAIEEEIARYRAALKAGTACPECRHVNEPGSRFCATCGSSLPWLSRNGKYVLVPAGGLVTGVNHLATL